MCCTSYYLAGVNKSASDITLLLGRHLENITTANNNNNNNNSNNNSIIIENNNNNNNNGMPTAAVVINPEMERGKVRTCIVRVQLTEP